MIQEDPLENKQKFHVGADFILQVYLYANAVVKLLVLHAVSNLSLI